jgi:addiction module HigA family antidote
MLRGEFIKPLGHTQAELAAKLGMPRVAVNAIINGKRTAMRLAKAFGTTPDF